MHWFFASLIAPFVWSLVNHADKLLLSRFFHGGSGGLMVFVGVVAFPLAVGIWLYDPSVLSIGIQAAAALIASGILYNVAAYMYLKALERRDASYVVPFWQLTPVCAYFFGVLLLNEFLSTDKLFGGIIVIAGALFLSMGYGKNRFRIDVRTAVLMTLSSATLALCYVFFKDADSQPFLQSMFWNQIGMTIFGFAFFLVPQFRGEFLGVVKHNTRAIVGVNILEQILEIAGVVGANFAVLLAPAAMVILVEYAAQPLFVFVFGVLFTILFPRLVDEDITPTTLRKRFIAIVIMTIGLLFVVL